MVKKVSKNKKRKAKKQKQKKSSKVYDSDLNNDEQEIVKNYLKSSKKNLLT